jgi:hypothetical protein
MFSSVKYTRQPAPSTQPLKAYIWIHFCLEELRSRFTFYSLIADRKIWSAFTISLQIHKIGKVKIHPKLKKLLVNIMKRTLRYFIHKLLCISVMTFRWPRINRLLPLRLCSSWQFGTFISCHACSYSDENKSKRCSCDILLINKAPNMTQIIRSVKNSPIKILQIFDPN